MERLNLDRLLDLSKIIHLVHGGTEPWIQIIWIYFPFFFSSFIRKDAMFVPEHCEKKKKELLGILAVYYAIKLQG